MISFFQVIFGDCRELSGTMVSTDHQDAIVNIGKDPKMIPIKWLCKSK